MAIRLEAGMYVKTRKEVTAYDPNTYYELGTLPVGTQCKIDRVAALLLPDNHIAVFTLLVHNNIQYIFLQSSMEASKENFEVL